MNTFYLRNWRKAAEVGFGSELTFIRAFDVFPFVSKRPYHSYLSHDGLVEALNVFSRYPVFSQRLAPGLLRRVGSQKRFENFEAGDIACAVATDIPIPCDPNGVVFGKDRIEDGLVG